MQCHQNSNRISLRCLSTDSLRSILEYLMNRYVFVAVINIYLYKITNRLQNYHRTHFAILYDNHFQYAEVNNNFIQKYQLIL